jgi:hypothetical protein
MHRLIAPIARGPVVIVAGHVVVIASSARGPAAASSQKNVQRPRRASPRTALVKKHSRACLTTQDSLAQ